MFSLLEIPIFVYIIGPHSAKIHVKKHVHPTFYLHPHRIRIILESALLSKNVHICHLSVFSVCSIIAQLYYFFFGYASVQLLLLFSGQGVQFFDSNQNSNIFFTVTADQLGPFFCDLCRVSSPLFLTSTLHNRLVSTEVSMK